MDCGEALIALPPALPRCTPHPYAALGAPYGPHQSPFALRQGVVERLLQAQAILPPMQPGWRLASFHGLRPVGAPPCMVFHTLPY